MRRHCIDNPALWVCLEEKVNSFSYRKCSKWWEHVLLLQLICPCESDACLSLGELSLSTSCRQSKQLSSRSRGSHWTWGACFTGSCMAPSRACLLVWQDAQHGRPWASLKTREALGPQSLSFLSAEEMPRGNAVRLAAISEDRVTCICTMERLCREDSRQLSLVSGKWTPASLLRAGHCHPFSHWQIGNNLLGIVFLTNPLYFHKSVFIIMSYKCFPFATISQKGQMRMWHWN